MRKVSVQGISGSGKTTVAAALAGRLGVPHVETDALVHGPGWTETSDGDLMAAMEPIVRSEGWVIDSDYRRKLGTLVLENADTVVWLDLPLHVCMRRLARRTFGRMVLGHELWNGNRESLRGAFGGWDSLFVFAVRKHFSQRRTFPEILARPELAHLDVVRLRSPKAVRAWLDEAPNAEARTIPIPADPVDEMYARGEIVRGTPLDRPITPHRPRPGTPPSEEIISEGREHD